MLGYLVLVSVLNLFVINNALECIVCLPPPNIEGNGDDIFPEEVNKPVYCDQLSVINESIAVRSCPSGSVGCHTQTSGRVTAKTCSKIPANDCKTANGITYCYCTGTRCNSELNITGSELSLGSTNYSTPSSTAKEFMTPDTTPLTAVPGSSKTPNKNKSSKKLAKPATNHGNPMEAAVAYQQSSQPPSAVNSAQSIIPIMPLLSLLAPAIRTFFFTS